MPQNKRGAKEWHKGKGKNEEEEENSDHIRNCILTVKNWITYRLSSMTEIDEVVFQYEKFFYLYR